MSSAGPQQAATVPGDRPSGRRNIRRQRRRRLAGLVLAVALLLALASASAPWSLIELRSFDYLSTLSPPPRPADSPLIVAIDEPSMAEIGLQWPWPRALHAKLVTALREAGAQAIGLDMIFAEPALDPANDQALAAVLGPDVVLAGDETLIRTPQADQFVRTEPLAAFTATGARSGIASIHLGADGVPRQMPVHEDGFALQLARIAGRSVARPTWDDALIQTFGPARTYETISYYQALDPRTFLPEGFFKGRTVIVGFSLKTAPKLDQGGADAFATSYTIRSGSLVAGAEIQATLFDNLTQGLFIHRAGRLTVLSSLLAAALLAGAVVWRASVRRSLALSLLVIAGIGAASFALLRLGLVFLPPIGPVAAYLLVVGAQTGLDYATERRRRREITTAFSHYLSPDIVARLADDPSLLKLGGERRTLTILFCDVRGFTTISETMKDDPEALTTLINRLLTPLSEVVLKSGGTIDKYIGDCVMAFWNAPLDTPGHAGRAVGAALDMLKAMDVLNGDLAAEAKAAGRPAPPLLRIGIGINTGDCVVGNMGSARRFDYSVLGDAVNLASRLEGESKNYGVPLLIGHATALELGPDFPHVELDSIAVKGRTALSPVYTVLPEADPDAMVRHGELLALKYMGALTRNHPLLMDLKEELPDLSRYYDILQSRVE